MTIYEGETFATVNLYQELVPNFYRASKDIEDFGTHYCTGRTENGDGAKGEGGPDATAADQIPVLESSSLRQEIEEFYVEGSLKATITHINVGGLSPFVVIEDPVIEFDRFVFGGDYVGAPGNETIPVVPRGYTAEMCKVFNQGSSLTVEHQANRFEKLEAGNTYVKLAPLDKSSRIVPDYKRSDIDLDLQRTYFCNGAQEASQTRSGPDSD